MFNIYTINKNRQNFTQKVKPTIWPCNYGILPNYIKAILKTPYHFDYGIKSLSIVQMKNLKPNIPLLLNYFFGQKLLSCPSL